MSENKARLLGATVALGFVGLMVFSACTGPSGEGGTGGNYEYVEVETPQGDVPCIIWDGTKAGNITCNWE